jgi:hypothetical protein
MVAAFHKKNTVNALMKKNLRTKFAVRFEVLTAVSMKMAVFLVVALCSLVESP